MTSQTNSVWNTLVSFDLQTDSCYQSRRSLQQVLVHTALKARQHRARGHRALTPVPMLDAVVQLQQGASASSQLAAGFPLLPLSACHGSCPLWAASATISPNPPCIKSHQDLLHDQGLSVAAVHPRQLEKASPFSTAAGPEKVYPPPRPLGDLPHTPFPSLVWQTAKCGNSHAPLREAVFNHCPLAPGRLVAGVSPPRQTDARTTHTGLSGQACPT